MIARVWRGRVRSGMLVQYLATIVRRGMNDYQKTPGNRGAYTLSREHADYGEIVMISLWDSLDAVARFTGPDVTLAQYYPEDRDFLLDFPERVDHYDVTG